MTTINRQPAGVSTGGQFTAGVRARSTIALDEVSTAARFAPDILAPALDDGREMPPPQCPWEAEIGYNELFELTEDYIPANDYYGIEVAERDAMRFRLVHRYPLDLVSSPTEAIQFTGEMDYDDEDERNEDTLAYEELAEALAADPDAAPPLVIDPSRPFSLLDGNHRAGLALNEGVRALPAYVRIA